MPRSQTIEVLNNADDVQRRLDWVLFSNDNEHYGSESDWAPGDPLYDEPSGCDGDQYVRPMFEEIDINSFHIQHADRERRVRCTDCDTFWVGEEPCFVCGTDVPDRTIGAYLAKYARVDADLTRPIYSNTHRQIQISLQRMSEQVQISFQRMLSQISQASPAAAWANLGYIEYDVEPFVYDIDRNLWRGMNPQSVIYDEATIMPPSHKARGEKLFVKSERKIFRTWVDEMRDWSARDVVIPRGFRIRHPRPTDFVREIAKSTFDVREQWRGWGEREYQDPQPYPTTSNPTRQRRPRQL